MDLILKDLPVQERYKFLTATVIPRPIAFVTTRDKNGVHNAAPFSFFNVFSEDPALVVLGFSSRPDGRKKDTLQNIRDSGTFVVNMVDHRVVDAMHVASSDLPHGESELDYAGVTLAPSRTTEVKRIAEAPASLECRLFKIMDLTERRVLVLGEVDCVHLLDEIVDPKTRRIIPARYSPLARLYGDHYAWLGERYAKAIPDADDVRAHRGEPVPRPAEAAE